MQKKKMSLKEAWVFCLKMWRWIVRQPCPRDISFLKKEYLKTHGFSEVPITGSCFLCEYSTHIKEYSCGACPGILVDKNFTCENSKYHFEKKPAAFLRELERLYKIYLANNKEIPTPECDKVLSVHKKSQMIGDFLEWLQEQNLHICEKSDSNDAFLDDFYYITNKKTEHILAKYFDINLDKVEEEKKNILEQLRR